MSSLAEISSAFDQILDRPLEEWTLEQIKLYQVLEKKLNKYRRTYIQAQFIQDQNDIVENVLKQKWYKSAESNHRVAVKEFLKQFKVMTFNLTRQPDALRMNLTISLPLLPFC